MSETEFRCDWKSWCVRIEGHDGDCEPATESKLHTPATPLDSALVLAARCARCQASPSVRCRGSINEPVTFHLARFVLASVIPVELRAPSPETGGAAGPTCHCPLPGVGNNIDCLSPLRGICQCSCHSPDPRPAPEPVKPPSPETGGAPRHPVKLAHDDKPICWEVRDWITFGR